MDDPITKKAVKMWGTTHELLKRRRTKIVATLGRSSMEDGVVEQLVKSGVDVVRLNMSHGSHEDHRQAHQRARAAAERLGVPLAVLVDLCGPKMRVGHFSGGACALSDGARVTVTTRDVLGSGELIPSQYTELADQLYPGDHILLDDGMIELEIHELEGTELRCLVIHGGLLKDCKGMNLPGIDLTTPPLTEKDREDAKFALDLGVEYLALSFVRQADDVRELKELIASAGSPTRVIAKIERPEAMEAIDEILDVADAIMVARGDLGVELAPEMVPIAQRQLVARARAKNKPAIVATQMLESMIEHPRPTRAELSDVASAVFSGADAIMLSAETAAGAYPVRAVEMMDRAARQAEAALWSEGAFGSIVKENEISAPLPVHLAVARSVAQLSRDVRVRTLAVLTRHGTTARVISAARPAAPIVALTADRQTYLQLNLLWGVVPCQVEPREDLSTAAPRVARELGLAEEGHYVLALSGLEASDDASGQPTIFLLRI